MESAAVGAFLKSVMGRLFLLLEKEYSKHRGLAQEAASIQQDLRMIAAAMDDQLGALRRPERTAVARLYSAEILDLAHDIEDCVDRFTHRLRCKHRGGGAAAAGAASYFHRVAHGIKKVQIRSSYADEIHKLKRRLTEARQRVIDAAPVGRPGGSPPSVMLGAFKPCCRTVTRSPVGLEKPLEEMLSLLREVDGEPRQLRVISIVGFGGSGKTTLARAVYDSPHAKETFHCRAWVSAAGTSPEISQRIKTILRDILQQVLPKDSMDLDADNNNLEADLKEYLTDKRFVYVGAPFMFPFASVICHFNSLIILLLFLSLNFDSQFSIFVVRYLIVIDGVQMDEWRAVNSAFVDSSTGSRMILTTTIQSVANVCSHGNGYVYQMDTPLGKKTQRS